MATSFRQHIARLEAHHRFTICAIFGILSFFSLGHALNLPFRLILGWDAYAACFLALAWTRIFSITPKEVVKMATLQHTSRMIIFVGVLIAACVSMVAVAFLLGSAKDLPMSARSGHIICAVSTVILSWVMVHTLFTLHYGYLYYRKHSPDQDDPGKRLLFPGDEKYPDYYDFAYFSFTVGMCFQVSDVCITSKQIRRAVLGHSVLSFAYNTAILALAMNLVAGLLG